MVDVQEPSDRGSEADHGELDSFERLYRDHFEAIYAYILRRAGRVDTPDLVADVFATAWRRSADIPTAPEAKLWLYGVARRVVSQHHRATARHERLKSKVGRTVSMVELNAPPDLSDLEAKVLGLIKCMKDEDRELVTLIVWDGLTHAEVASILGCSVNAVRVRWHRCLKRLRHEIATAAAATPRRPGAQLTQTLAEES